MRPRLSLKGQATGFAIVVLGIREEWMADIQVNEFTAFVLHGYGFRRGVGTFVWMIVV